MHELYTKCISFNSHFIALAWANERSLSLYRHLTVQSRTTFSASTSYFGRSVIAAQNLMYLMRIEWKVLRYRWLDYDQSDLVAIIHLLASVAVFSPLFASASPAPSSGLSSEMCVSSAKHQKPHI